MGNEIDGRIQTDSKDFAGIKQAFFEFAQNNFAEIWSDFNESQFMVLISDLIAYLGDLLTWNIDKQTSENFLTTARRRQSVIDIGIMLDYRLRSQVPSTGEVTFTIDTTSFVYSTPIPVGTRVSNSGTLIYETTVETFVPFGDNSVTIPIKEGETIRETVIGDGALGQSNGTSGQEFTFEFKNVILANNVVDLKNDIEVVVGNITFSPVFNIVSAQSTDEVYVVNTDDNSVTSIRFGNGVFGTIPPVGVDIEATYRVLLSEREADNFGNLNTSAINTIEDAILGLTEVTNNASLSGGRDEESIEEAKINIPRSVRTGDRAVSVDDFVSIAEQFPGVAKAIALQGENDLDIDLYIAPDGGGAPSQQLKNDIIIHFESRKMIRTKVFPRDPIFQPVTLDMRVTAEPNNRNIDVKTAIERALADLFDFDNLTFGQGVFLKSTGGSDIFDINETLETVNGIANIRYNKITLKPSIYDEKFDNSGTPELLDECCNTRQGASRKEYEVLMDNTTEYLVKSKIFGDSTSLNDTRLEDNFKTFLLSDGESTDVGTSFLTDASRFFLIDQFKFQTLIDSSGAQFKIISNDKDTLTLESGTPVLGDYQIVERLEGYYVNPNIDQASTFLIISNDANSVSVASGLSEVAVITDSYEIFRFETNKFDTDAHEGTETSGTATDTTFADTTSIGFGNGFFNGFVVIFQEGPAANIPVTVTSFADITGTFTIDSLGTGNEPLAGNRFVVAPKFILGKRTTVSAIPTPTTTDFSGEALGGEGDGFYIGHVVNFLGGTNEGLSRKVTAYDDTGLDVLTTNDFPLAPAAGDEFHLAKEYQTDDQTVTFAIISTDVSSADIYLFQASELVGDLTPRRNQILELNSEDLKVIVTGGS